MNNEQTFNIYSDFLNHSLYQSANEELKTFLLEEIQQYSSEDVEISIEKQIEVSYEMNGRDIIELIDYNQKEIVSLAKKQETLQFRIKLQLTITSKDELLSPSNQILWNIDSKMTDLSQIRDLQSYIEDHNTNKVCCLDCNWKGHHAELFDIEGNDLGESYECPECNSNNIIYLKNSQRIN